MIPRCVKSYALWTNADYCAGVASFASVAVAERYSNFQDVARGGQNEEARIEKADGARIGLENPGWRT